MGGGSGYRGKAPIIRSRGPPNPPCEKTEGVSHGDRVVLSGPNPGNPHPKTGRPEGTKDHVGQSNTYCSKAGNDMSYL
jgi:hypothetical protein